MRHIKEVLVSSTPHQLSIREIASSCGLPSSTVNDYLARAQAAGLSWRLPEGLDDQQIQQQLLSASQAAARGFAVSRAATTLARLGRNPQRTRTSFRDAALVLAGICERFRNGDGRQGASS